MNSYTNTTTLRFSLTNYLCHSILLLLITCCLYLHLGKQTTSQAIDLDSALSWFPQLPDWTAYSHLAIEPTNEPAADLSTHQLIRRAGFKFENHLAIADDGYITQLIRIVNPLLAKKSYLKRYPVIIQHGQTSNSRNFVFQSNKQTWPMRYPPNHQELIFGRGSSNRSLAFALANQGFDVWLASTRGVDHNNMGFITSLYENSIITGANRKKNMTRGEDELLALRIRSGFWSFTLDDQIAHDLPAQIEKVRKVTRALKVHLVGYSNTALTTFAMFSVRPDMSALVDSYIATAPVVYYKKLTGFFKWFMEEWMQLVPKDLDTQLFINDSMAGFLRRLIRRLCYKYHVRYTLCKFSADLFFGDSSQFRTQLEAPFFGHMFRQTSWKCLAQHLQIVKTRRLAKFDYGVKLNRRFYGSREPPEYDLSRIDPNLRVLLVSGSRDCWANKATLDELRRKLPMKPVLDLVLNDYNHLDLTAAYDVDVQVNLPLIEYLNKRHELLMKEDGLDELGRPLKELTSISTKLSNSTGNIFLIDDLRVNDDNEEDRFDFNPFSFLDALKAGEISKIEGRKKLNKTITTQTTKSVKSDNKLPFD